jgi:hypothetical protein
MADLVCTSGMGDAESRLNHDKLMQKEECMGGEERIEMGFKQYDNLSIKKFGVLNIQHVYSNQIPCLIVQV